jgi:hypothetical protein
MGKLAFAVGRVAVSLDGVGRVALLTWYEKLKDPGETIGDCASAGPPALRNARRAANRPQDFIFSLSDRVPKNLRPMG